MNTSVVQIQARLGSTRLPGKVLYTLGSRRVIGWVVEQSLRAERPTDTILTLGDRPENEAIREWCERNGIAYDTGPEENLLERHLQAAAAAGSDPIVRVTGDCPFVPPGEIDRVIREHRQNDARYTTNFTDDMPIGTAVDVINRDVLEELRDLGECHPVKRLRANPDDWDVLYTANEQLTEFSNVHTAVDTPADYWRLVDAVDAVGEEPHDITKWLSQR